jgi:hypothetical protein
MCRAWRSPTQKALDDPRPQALARNLVLDLADVRNLFGFRITDADRGAEHTVVAFETDVDVLINGRRQHGAMAPLLVEGRQVGPAAGERNA